MSRATDYRRTNSKLTGRERPPCLECFDREINACAELPLNEDPECMVFISYVTRNFKDRKKAVYRTPYKGD